MGTIAPGKAIKPVVSTVSFAVDDEDAAISTNFPSFIPRSKTWGSFLSAKTTAAFFISVSSSPRSPLT